jgi:23S rRNA pseudouridine1911/1915/1917 synthase
VVEPSDNDTGTSGARERLIVSPLQARNRVDKVLAEWLGKSTSRSAIQRWIDEKLVTIDGVVARSKDIVRTGQVIAFERLSAQTTTAQADANVKFDVLWEDESLLVVNKPAGLVVHPARGHQSGTLVNGLVARPGFGRPSADGRDAQGALRPGIVHRIDKGTSGLLVVAKSEAAREGLKTQFANHTIERQYWAATVGLPTRRHIDTYYSRHPTNRLKFTSLGNGGRRAATHVDVIEQLDLASIVHCRLETGRTHQIRVHLSEQANAPLLGDKLYGKSTLPEALAQRVAGLGRQALHAFVLGFVHPITAQPLRFEAPLPPDLIELVSRLRAK